jgi:dihydroxyacetone kinase-like protein
MKKFLNNPDDAVDEMLEGYVLANQALVERPHPRVIRARHRHSGVGIITGGGSGHKPAFLGYVGKGVLDAVAVGDIFTSPPAIPILAAIKAADNGKGVVCLIGNYSGDVMNFEMAADLAREDGIKVEIAIATDDVGAGLTDRPELRRGVAGQVLIWKLCGAMAAVGRSAKEIVDAAGALNASTRTMGVATTSLIVPAAGRPTFEIGEDEMEFGVGHHGEPGLSREPMQSVDQIVDRLLDSILAELRPGHSDNVVVLVNGLGATPQLELYVAFRRVVASLALRKIVPAKAMVGEFFTALEMAGFSLTLSRVDRETLAYINAPAYPASFSQFSQSVA